MDEVQFIASQKGGKLLVLNKYMLTFGHERKKGLFWKCLYKGCGVRAITSRGERLMKVDGIPHNHEPDEEKLKIRMFYHNLKERSKNEKSKTVKQIYREEVAKFEGSPDARLRLPKFITVEKPMYKVRGAQKPLKDKGEVYDPALCKMEFIESSRGGKLLILNNYLFRGQRKQKKSSAWVCCEEGCPTMVTVSHTDNQLLRVKGTHNHDPQQEKIYRKKFYNLIKSRITEDPTMPLAKLYREESAKFATTPEIKASLPSRDQATGVIANIRAQITNNNDDNTKTLDVHNRRSYKMEFIESNKGNCMLLALNNYLFKRHKNHKKASFWKCWEKLCPAVVVVSLVSNRLLKMKGTHNHDPHQKKICHTKFYNVLKSRITQNPRMSHLKIYREEMAKCPTSHRVKGYLPPRNLAMSAMSTMKARVKRSNTHIRSRNTKTKVDDLEIKQEPEDEEILPEGESLFHPAVIIKEEPVTREEEPMTWDEEPVTREDEPVTREDEPVTWDEEPVTREEEPVTREEEPVAREDEPVAREEEE